MIEADLLPHWRQALKEFLSSKPEPGSVIRHDWLMKQFGIQEPVTAQDQVEASLEFLRQFTEFREELLECHLIELKALPGVGYEVVHPRDQTKLALRIRSRNVNRELRKMVRSIACVNTAMLSETERREQADGLAKAAAMSSMFNRRKFLGRTT